MRQTTRCAAAALAVAIWAAPAGAQTPAAASERSPSVEFLPDTSFHMTAERLSGDDPRFVWDANFGGELDLVDYGWGRISFEGNYQAILGEQLRTFDPNQGTYILAGAMSVRVRTTEIAAVFHHQSRHLSDRLKEEAIDWNMLGFRARRRWRYGESRIDARADVRGVVEKSYVDYSWALDLGVRGDVKVRPRVGLLAAAAVHHLGVDGSRSRVGGQSGYRVEGGVRFEGRAGAIELFVSGERRVDPYPLEFGTAQWITAGFRLLSR